MGRCPPGGCRDRRDRRGFAVSGAEVSGADVSPAIELVGLGYRYPDGREALVSVDLVVEQGERVALLGPNGAGKSTLVLHLNGILQPSAGTARVTGIGTDSGTSSAELAELRRRVQLVFADPDDQLFMPTVQEDVGFGPANAGLRGADLADRVAVALASVGASDLAHRTAHRLSSGEKRRVALATALALQPEVLVLDEPTAGLDPAGQSELVGLLDQLTVRNTTLLVVTHDLAFAQRVCERAIVIDGGRIHADAPIDRILSNLDLLSSHRLA